MQGKPFRQAVFLAALCAAGGSAVYLCSRFEGFSHPLAMPLVLGGVCAAAWFLYLLV